MKSFEYVILDQIGIHARLAGLLVKTARAFHSTCMIRSNGKSADLKKLMMLMGLGIKHGAKISVSAEGDDEEVAIMAIKKIVEENL